MIAPTSGSGGTASDAADARFGSGSRVMVEPDQLGRPRTRLVIDWRGLGDRAADTAVFDVDDLDLIATGGPAAWTRIVRDWTPGSARPLLPWAVVHRAARAPFMQHVHADASCAIGCAPGRAATCAEVFGPDVAWLPYATPGPELAEMIAAVQGTAALVQHLGLFVWGATEAIVNQQRESLDAAATGWLEEQSVPAVTNSSSARADDHEVRLLELRRGASTPGPVVLSVDPSLVSVADRQDLERIVRESATAEMTWPWAIDSGKADPSSAAGPDRSTGRARLEPGIGLVCAGPDEASARALAIIAGHTHRVTSLLIDLFGGVVSLEESAREGGLPALVDPLTSIPGALRGRVYIVTGAASGIGRDVARHLAALGASLALADLNSDGLERTADELELPSGRPLTVSGDLTEEACVDHLVAAAIRRFGGVDGAVLNAGIALPGPIRSLAADDWRRSLDVNATSHFLLVKRLLPVLETQGLGGSLVFIGSKNMFSPGAGFGAYSASKAALAQLARVVAIEAGPFGVRSNIVNPDNVFGGSALWSPELRAQRASVYGIKPEDLEAYYTQRNLMKVPITGEDVAKGVAFLLSDDALRTTACVLTVDGGVPGVFPR